MAKLDDFNSAIDFAEATLGELAARGYDELAMLREDYVRDFDFRPSPELSKIDFALYKHTQVDGRIRVVAQVYKRRFIVNLIWANGVFVARDGVTSPVPEEQLWEYM